MVKAAVCNTVFYESISADRFDSHPCLKAKREYVQVGEWSQSVKLVLLLNRFESYYSHNKYLWCNG